MTRAPPDYLYLLYWNAKENSEQLDRLIKLQTTSNKLLITLIETLQNPTVTQQQNSLPSEKNTLSIPVHSMDKPVDTVKTVIIEGKAYTSSKLNQVIDWLNNNPDKAELTVREISMFTGVSKSWVAIAKKHKGNV